MSRVLGAALRGVDGVPVEVEVRISSQLPRIDIVGLPEAAVRESAARVRAAIAAVGADFPDRRITVNLAPASLRKSGAGLDLPIAVGILAAAGQLEAGASQGTGFLGELALDGRLRPIRGALALVVAAREAGCGAVVVPAGNAAEASLAPGIQVLGAADLAGVIAHLQDRERLPESREPPVCPADPEALGVPDLRDVRGQERAKRALEIAAAGGHAMLLRGPPGSGKTMLATRLPGLLPPLEFEEALEATRIHSAAGRLPEADPIVRTRPFRAPHHTASVAGILGGGSPPRPGEVSLAHHGVLFLDELPEFQRRVLESLRQVLESGRIELARAHFCSAFPARFQLVAAANPCPCGWRLSQRQDCRCNDGAVARYAARVSGPLLDRIDLHVAVPALDPKELDDLSAGASSQQVRARVTAARQRQSQRLSPLGLRNNAQIPDGSLDTLTAAEPDARLLLARSVERLGLSARAARRILRVARTIADLAEEAKVTSPQMAEAIDFREGGVRF